MDYKEPIGFLQKIVNLWVNHQVEPKKIVTKIKEIKEIKILKISNLAKSFTYVFNPSN